jgi:hypothetical protein
MSQTCRDCSRVNPSEAAYCYYDGVQLNGRGDLPADGSSISFSAWVFPSPFVFPSGEVCRNFPQLARACRKNPQGAGDLLAAGFLESFLGSLGRVDLALAAREAARHPDRERGLDDFLSKLPGTALEPAQLQVEPADIDLGTVQLGEERPFDLVLRNGGDRLVFGKAAADDCPWLVFGDSAASEKLFQFVDQTVIPVRVRADRLRAYTKPQKGEIVLESNGGNLIVTVSVMVPIKPFPEGVLAGAVTPRQLAEKAKASQAPAAALIESGAVARWYEMNGWTYPVQGPNASGLAAIQQLFEALGLVKAPKVELSDPAIALAGRPGERLEQTLTVTTPENRPVYAHAVSDQPWLTVGKAVSRGRSATLPLTIEAVPHEPGKSLRARLKVTANGNKRFEVPLVLAVADAPPVGPAPRAAASHPTAAVSAPAVPTEVSPTPAPVAVAVPAAGVELAVAGVATAAPTAARPSRLTPERRQLLVRLLPVALVVVGILVAIVHDLLPHKSTGPQPLPPIDPKPLLKLKFDESRGGQGDFLQNSRFPLGPTMRFGVLIPDPKDPNNDNLAIPLTYDPFGRTCNTCVRVGSSEFLLGDTRFGQWEAAAGASIKQSLGTDPLEGDRERIGSKAKWVFGKVTIEQQVEIIPGGLSADGKRRLLDTCLVRYVLANNDPNVGIKVGLRFLLDTYIGRNDGVPFTIAGDKELCKTFKDFDGPDKVPDFVSALEHPDVNKPGTVAHVSLKVGGRLEPPSRVILGAWPDDKLFDVDPVKAKDAHKQDTLWDVPVMSMGEEKLKSDTNRNGDSAVTLYWKEKELGPRETRQLGFAYGLGSVTGDTGKGSLGLTTGGELIAGQEFTLTAYVKDPVAGQTVTLTLPKGLNLIAGKEKEEVKAGGGFSTVSWRLKADAEGVYTVGLASSAGGSVEHPLAVLPGTRVFDK